MRRFGLSLVLAGSLLAVTATAALGHECTIASRSAQGDTGSLHSSRWARLTLQDVFGFIHEDVGGDPLTGEQIDVAVGLAIDAGLPADGWVIRSDKTIGGGSSNPNLADGKGLDHLVDSVGGTIVAIYLQVAGG
ncbi:MAG: hypothetical protein ACJ77U_01275 [Chloroflexota bacterium]